MKQVLVVGVIPTVNTVQTMTIAVGVRTFFMTAKPFYQLEVFLDGWRMPAFRILDIPEYTWMLKAKYKLWSFPGKTCTVCCVTNRENITREHCLKAASDFTKGNYIVTYVDLYNLTSYVENGSVHPPP